MDKIYFTVNGEHYSLSGSEASPSTSLYDYLHYTLQLFGTKAMCHEGGCGACIVTVSQTHPVTKEEHIFAVNSCLVHILSCHQWDITTIEGVGNRKDGYHPLQSRLAAFNGTQCGYCTPGWIMNMYSLYESSNKKLTSDQIERSFGGNMCRCTGYRPILDAFKSFAVDSDHTKLTDMEDLVKCKAKCARRCSTIDNEWCVIDNKKGELLQLDLSTNRWYKAFNVQDVFKILAKEGTDSYVLVAGNTGHGVYRPTMEPRIYIDISSIELLKDTLHAENLVLGAGLSITDVMVQFKKWSQKDDFKYLDEFYKHLDMVAHVPVRNIGTIGGNLAMKNTHPDFPSDIFLLLETVQATVTILQSDLEKAEVNMKDFLKVDLRNKLILDVKLPPLSSSYYIRTYKLMPRAQNAHAMINAGFLFKLDRNHKVVKAIIVYGAISPAFTRATETEKALIGVDLFSNEAVEKAPKSLKNEIFPVDMPPEPSPVCRKTLALNLLYKAILSLSGPSQTSPRNESGGSLLDRGLSRGSQTFDTDKALWPLNQPVPKLEALTQCAGEVRYSCDTNPSPREVHVAFVLSTICKGEIVKFDDTEAMKLPGVVAFFTAKDIPGTNSFTPTDVPWMQYDEEILASKTVSYYGQPVGLIAAVSHKLALKASELVKVTYNKSTETPVLSIEEALLAPDKDKRIKPLDIVTPTRRGADIEHVIKGTVAMPSQFHYPMETQSCKVTNTERGVKVRSSTQWMDLVQVAVAHALDLPVHQVEVVVSRVGGAYGGKASRSALAATGAAMAARLLARPASLALSLPQHMRALGKRMACSASYEAGVNNTGVIQYLDIKYYTDCGSNYNDSAAETVKQTLQRLYTTDSWTIEGNDVLTDTPSHTWCRAPGTTEGVAIVEHVMEHIAYVTKKDAIDVRIANIDPAHSAIVDMITNFKKDCDFEARKVAIDKFNSENAWRKKALSLSIMAYPIDYVGNYSATVSVYHADGTVAIAHGGIEMGQGINTKVAQVCAYTLKIPLNKVVVRGSDSFTSPNNIASNGSITSESVAFAVIKACYELLARFEDVKKDMNEPTWEEIVKAAFQKGINLQASYQMSALDALQGYEVYGVCASEAEIDVLCCSHALRRLDLCEDTGVSLSPEVDVGQIEGALVMGLGLWTCEHLQYSTSGRLLTDSTWTYKPAGVRDIPADMRIVLRHTRSGPGDRPGAVLRSKATGEPALALAVTAALALRRCVQAARTEFHYTEDWVHIDTPYCTENMLKAIAPKTEDYKLK